MILLEDARNSRGSSIGHPPAADPRRGSHFRTPLRRGSAPRISFSDTLPPRIRAADPVFGYPSGADPRRGSIRKLSTRKPPRRGNARTRIAFLHSIENQQRITSDHPRLVQASRFPLIFPRPAPATFNYFDEERKCKNSSGHTRHNNWEHTKRN